MKSTHKVLKSATKETMVVSTTPLKLVSKEKKMEKRQNEGEKRHPTLKERQEKIYPFPDSDLPDMLDQLLEKQLIQLPKCKRPAEMGRVNDPNYCKYHRVISHPVEKCFVLKELILKLALDKKIELELDDMAQTNHAAVIIQSDSRLSAIWSLIQFGSLEPVVIYSSSKDLQNNDFRADGPKEEEKQVDNVEEGWTLVTRRTKRKQSFSQKESGSYRTYRSKGYIREQKLNQILINNGFAINILSKSTMNQLGISVEELSNSKLVIQGFNQGAQRAIGTVRLEIVIGDLKVSTIFHVIDSRTTYKMLLGRPWIHENGIVTSTLHQCFKFHKQGIRKVDADSRPFTKAESHFADAKFYTKSEDVSEIISTEVPVTKGTFKNEQEMITSKKSNKGDALNSQQNGESTTETKLRAPEAEKIATLQKEVSNLPVLCYISFSRHKKGESPFAECSKNLTVKNTEILKENFTAPLTKIEKGEAKKIEKKDLEAYLPERRTVEGFDPKAYKLMAKAGYDFTTRTELKSVKIFDERPELSPTQKKLQKQGYSIPNSRAGIGYQSSEPVRITGKRKVKVANTCHITVEESKDSEEGKNDRSQRSSVFDRIAFSAIRPSVFQRVSTSIAKDSNQVSTCSSTRLSAFQRLNTNAKKVQSISPTPTTRKSAFKRLSVSVTRGQKKASISVLNKSSLVTEDEEIRSAFPSRMKRKMSVSVNTEGSLKVKRHDVVFTRPEDNELEDEVDVAGYCHVIIEETSDHDIFEEDVEAAPLSLEDGGQSTIDELKEVNLGTKEEPRPTFISTQLSENDENEYVNLLKAYKDVFAWSYKEMPGLDPKVAVHRLAIKPEHRPVKQAQRRFRPELISQIEEEVNKLIEAGFIHEVKYPIWIANIVPVRKKNGQLRVCVDFCDLNNTCPKDDFPLPIMEIMIDATAGHESLSFMDGSSGYNQIRMALDDEEKTAFQTPKGIYCYKVMPFGLKNAGATYQHAMQRIFDDMLHKHIECYVDDLVVKSKKKCDHLKDLKLVLDRLRKYQLRMNPLKSALLSVRENKKADALANLATTLTVSEDILINISLCQKWIVPSIESQYEEADVIYVYAIDEEDWRQPIIDYLEHGKLHTDPRHRAEIRRRAARFIYYKDTLYRRSYEGLLLRCLGKEESIKALEEAHSGICGVHQSGPKLQYQLKRMGYYWPTMIHDSMHFAKYCEACQFHANFIHQPPEPLHPTIASWPFEAWGLDLVGPITPKSSAGHSYILAGTDYFSKWAEVVPLREAKKENIVNFVQTHIIYRYGIPHRIVTDNGRQFANTLMDKLCEKFNFKYVLKKVVSKTKRDWQEKIGEALWAYRTAHRTSTDVTPYSLVYGVEAILPLEREIPSLRMAIQEELTTEDNARLRLQELEALEKKRLEAQQALECYQVRMSKAFDKQVRPRSFQVGDLVLVVRRHIITTRHTGNKFTPKWDGPYIVKEVFTNGAYKIINQDELRIGPINGKFLKKFYA
ncbi:uncharacterized protein E6C27_scaffold438G00090 [Cucumis melo var. makuwa]|uniref:Integrase catalytic domain-containing protein n=1 Tax=Cucumis melo var. makuwa TaxID=1194695 RepID=A0A5A7UQP2_CUCMM|nr:uncharacterized protein E6C27_scaffold438G00090 [Cucumis melo var. makuwa]